MHAPPSLQQARAQTARNRPGIARRRLALLILPGLIAFVTADHAIAAQQRAAESPEFARQSVLIVNFTPRNGADVKAGKRVADEVRGRVSRLLNKKEAEVVKGYQIARAMEESSLNPDSTFSPTAYRAMGSVFRADEYLQAYIGGDSTGIRLWGELVLSRDERMRQPLPTILAPSLDSAAELFAHELIAARTQLVPQRRCENALNAGQATRAETAARVGVAAYPRSTLARACLLTSMRQLRVPPQDILVEARRMLAADSTNPYGIEAVALALDGMQQPDAAAVMWFRLLATDSTNITVAVRVARALNDDGNTKAVEPLIARLTARYPNDISVTEQRWRAAFRNRDWPRAVSAGEALLARVPSARTDSSFQLALATAYRESKRPLKAIELLTRATVLFPKDARLYTLYAQVIRAEADSVIPRGLALFPNSAELLAVQARELRTVGKLPESLEMTRRAMAMDTSLKRGYLVIAQLELDLGHPDSALASLRRAARVDPDTAAIAQFALSSGNAFYRNANSTQSPSDYRVAYRFLVFSDTVRTSPQARFLSGAAALGAARTSLNDARQRADKTESCRIARSGAELLPAARSGLSSGIESYADMARQSLEYLDKLGPYYEDRLRSFCGITSSP